MENTPQSYALALLTLMGDQEANEENPPLGWACHWEIQSSNYSLAAHRLLRALIEHPPSPEANQVVARQFMAELLQCENSAVIDLVHTLNSERFDSPANWAAAVYEGLSQNGNILPLSNLAASYLNNLVIPIVNPTNKWSPTQYESPDPDIKSQDNNSLLQSATLHRDQMALRELVFRRDGPRCLITGIPFEGDVGTTVPINCAHIIPFSVYDKMAVHATIEMFTGSKVRAAEVQQLINHPRNAIDMEINALLSINEGLGWGIEAKIVNNEWKYYFHVVRPAKIYATMPLHDGDDIEFGKGDDGNSIQLPDPQICNLHLAIARVFMASGFTEVIDRLFKDWDDGANDELWPGID